MKGKKFAAVGALVMAMALSACGSKEDSQKEDVSAGGQR